MEIDYKKHHSRYGNVYQCEKYSTHSYIFLHTFCLIVEQNFINWLLSSSFDLFEQQIYSRL